MITNIINTPKVNSAVQMPMNKSQQVKFNQDTDKVSFTGISSLIRTKNKGEVKELIELLYSSTQDTLYRKNPNFKQNWFTKIWDGLIQSVDRYCKLSLSTSDDTIIAIAKKGNKVVGGYTMYLIPEKCTACVEFITLSPELKNTKTGKDILINIGKNIYEQLKDTHITEIAWLKNENCMKLFEKLKPQITNPNIFMPDEHIMLVNKFGEAIENLARKYHFQGK